MADGLEQSAIVEPIDPFERGVFHRFQGAPGVQTDVCVGRGSALQVFESASVGVPCPGYN